jgi:hypothetical protein
LRLTPEMSEQSEEKPTWLGSLDKAVFGFCGLLGFMFALPFGDAIYHGTPISSSQIGFLVLGVACAAAGPMCAMFRTKAVAPATASLEIAARDARTWIAVMLFAFGYFFFRTPVPPPLPSASQITAAVAAKFPPVPSADEIAEAIIRKLPKQAPEAAEAQIANYGVDGPQQYHAVVKIRNWQDYKDYKGVLITRPAFADRDRMTDDWIAKSIGYAIDAPTLTLVAVRDSQISFVSEANKFVEYNFVVLPYGKAPEQIRTLGDVEKLGGKILAVADQGIPIPAVLSQSPPNKLAAPTTKPK